MSMRHSRFRESRAPAEQRAQARRYRAARRSLRAQTQPSTPAVEPSTRGRGTVLYIQSEELEASDMRVLVECLVCLMAVAACWARELDPAACAARFDVQRDKIIRTEESREMGARYLSELDVGSRHECRRLCCETDACDVFVYEEKSPGSCYLFNCGPPEDFRCKFTAHGNFSSGVLALSRRLAELQDQERLAAVPPPAPAPALPPAPTTTTTTTPPPPPRPVITAPPIPIVAPTHNTPHIQSSRCSRYQWECHTGGECIAVYNACDGIPQCADGSDEAPELGCPAAAPAAPAAAPAVRPRPDPPRTTPASPPPPPQPVYPVQMYESEAAAEASAEAAAAAAAGGERWPHRLLQAQPRRYPNTVEGGVGAGPLGPHIFSHKGGLVQEEAPLPAFEPPAPQQPWPRRPAWPQHQGIENSGWGGWGRDWADERRAWPPAQPLPPLPPAPPAPPAPPRDREPDMPYLSAKTMPELPLVFPAPHSLHDAPKKGLGLSEDAPPAPAPAPHAPPATEDRPPENTTKKKASAVQSDSKESSEPSGHVTVPPAPATATAAPAVAAGAGGSSAAWAVGAVGAAAQDDHDGLSEHPPAAVMLLVLGVVMTGAMGVLVGCRARAARRRLRRGGKPYAHDADYLVNGMYL